MSYSEWGPSNGQINKRPLDTGLNHSGWIPIWSGDLQLQGLSLCGSVRAGRQNWIFLKFYHISDLHRSPVDRRPLMIWTLCFLCLPCPPIPSDRCKYEGMDMHSLATVLCQILVTISLKSGNLRVKMSYSEGGPSNGQISKRLIDTGRNHSGSIPIWSGDLQLQGLTICGSVTAGRQNWIFLKFFLTCIGAL